MAHNRCSLFALLIIILHHISLEDQNIYLPGDRKKSGQPNFPELGEVQVSTWVTMY